MVRNSIDDFCSLIDRVIHSKDCKKFQNVSVDEKNDHFSQYDMKISEKYYTWRFLYNLHSLLLVGVGT